MTPSDPLQETPVAKSAGSSTTGAKGESSLLPPQAATPSPTKPTASSSKAANSGPSKSPPSSTASAEAKKAARAKARYWKRLELTWTVVPIILLIVVAGLSTPLLYKLDTGPSAFGATPNVYIDVTGHQWYWVFNYTDPDGHLLTNGTNVTQTQNVLYIPANAIVEVNVTSADVIHDFNIPALGVRIDAIPGIINHYWFTIPSGTKPGTHFLIQCTEFCGQGHYAMVGDVVVTPANPLLN